MKVNIINLIAIAIIMIIIPIIRGKWVYNKKNILKTIRLNTIQTITFLIGLIILTIAAVIMIIRYTT